MCMAGTDSYKTLNAWENCLFAVRPEGETSLRNKRIPCRSLSAQIDLDVTFWGGALYAIT